MQDCYKKDIPIASKSRNGYYMTNLKQKEGEGSKDEEFNATKEWYDNFRK